MNEEHVFYQQEVEEFAKIFFVGKKSNTKTEHARMNAIIDPAKMRFKALRDELKLELSEKDWPAAKEEAQEITGAAVPV